MSDLIVTFNMCFSRFALHNLPFLLSSYLMQQSSQNHCNIGCMTLKRAAKRFVFNFDK